MNLVLNRIPPLLRFICALPLYLYDGVANPPKGAQERQ